MTPILAKKYDVVKVQNSLYDEKLWSIYVNEKPKQLVFMTESVEQVQNIPCVIHYVHCNNGGNFHATEVVPSHRGRSGLFGPKPSFLYGNN